MAKSPVKFNKYKKFSRHVLQSPDIKPFNSSNLGEVSPSKSTCEIVIITHRWGGI